jgi:hypothetical protein
MVKLIRLAGAVLLVGATAFCTFGFLAAPEAGADAGRVQFLYGSIGLLTACGAGWLAWPRQSRAA